jgi:hypothetical protein
VYEKFPIFATEIHSGSSLSLGIHPQSRQGLPRFTPRVLRSTPRTTLDCAHNQCHPRDSRNRNASSQKSSRHAHYDHTHYAAHPPLDAPAREPMRRRFVIAR